MLISLPRSFEHCKNAFIYVKEDTITLDEVHTIVRSKEFSTVKDLKIYNHDKGLSVSKEGNESRVMSKSNRFDKSRLKCFIVLETRSLQEGFSRERGQ